MRGFLIALQFLTILPITVRPEPEKEDFGRSLVWFPVVGALIGLALSICLILLSFFLPQIVVAAFILAGSIIITGGVHLDGFADTCDGIFGAATKEKILEIMRDSRIGTLASVGITTLLILKVSILASLEPKVLCKILIFMPIFARWSQVAVCCLSRYAREEGKAKYFIEYAKKKELIIGALFTLAVSILLLRLKGVILFLTSIIPVLLSIKYIKTKIDGMTGDTVGAINEVAEAAVLLFGLIIARINL